MLSSHKVGYVNRTRRHGLPQNGERHGKRQVDRGSVRTMKEKALIAILTIALVLNTRIFSDSGIGFTNRLAFILGLGGEYDTTCPTAVAE